MVPESQCTFTYKTVKSYKIFEDYIKDKLKAKKIDQGINEGYLIDKNYLDYWKKFTDYEILKNEIEYMDYRTAKNKIIKYRKKNKLQNYQEDASQFSFLTPSSFYQNIKENGGKYVLIDKNFWKLICLDEGLEEEGGMKYFTERGKIIFIFGNLGKVEIFTNDNIITNGKQIVIKEQIRKTNFPEEEENDNSEMEKLLLLYAFEQEMKSKMNNLTYKDNNFKKYYLISKEWILEYKRYYHYNELCKMINNRTELKNVLNKGYIWAKKNIDFALSKLCSKKPKEPFPNKLRDENTFLSEGNLITINNNLPEITYWKNFEIVNEELKNLFANSKEHEYNISGASSAKVFINEGKIILDLSNDENNEGNYAFEIGVITNRNMIFNDEYIFQYNNDDSKNNHFEYFTKDIYSFQKDKLDFDINLKCSLSNEDGFECGNAFKTP